MIDRLEAVSSPYSVLFCDVWGVVHNGVRSFAEACAALARARSEGKVVVLVTNAPRPHPAVQAQLRGLGVPDDAYDRIVTSGDVTQDLIRQGPRRVFHLGPERDQSIYEGIDVDLVEEPEASAVICTGFFDDDVETPDDYAEMLARFRSRNLPLVCANPDIVVEKGDRLIYCAGALARAYAHLGGRTLIAGKPHAPIYDACLTAAGAALGRAPERSEVLAVGDGMLTDVKGAIDNGLDILYVSGGIHAADYAGPDGPDPDRLKDFLRRQGYAPVATIAKLR